MLSINNMSKSELKNYRGKYCCLPGCNSASSNKIRLYQVPNGKKRFGVSTVEWTNQFHQVIFKYRYDMSFKQRVKLGKAFICEKHFNVDDIQTTVTKSWIKIGCLPFINMPVKSHQTVAKRRRDPLTHSFRDATVAASASIDINIHLPKSSPLMEMSSLNDVLHEYNSLNISKWRLYSETNFMHLTYYENIRMHGVASVSFFVSVLENDKLSFSIAVNGRLCSDLIDQISIEQWSLEETLKFLIKVRCCNGYDDVVKKDGWLYMPMCLAEGSFLRYISKSCKAIILSDSSLVCSECSNFWKEQNRQQKRIARLQKKPLSKYTAVSKTSKARLSASWQMQQKRLKELEKEFISKGVTVSKQCAKILESVSKKKQKNGFFKEWWSRQTELQQSNTKYARRYSPSIIRFCLKLYAKSPSAYQLLQEVLVLPAPRLLRSERNKSGYLQIGLQKEVLLRISNAAASSGKRCDSMAVVAFDEMTIKEEIAYCSATGEIVGYVDFGEESLTCCSKSKEEVATHMLAVFVRGITNKQLDGVVAYYCTKGINFQELMLVITDLLLEIPLQTSITIYGLVFDGLAANRTVMKMLASACNDEVPYRMRNPAELSRYIYFIPDPPHLLKTCRNNLINKNKHLWNNGIISVEPVKDLFREDIMRDELRLFYKLTESHIMPTSWEKMNVKLAAQLLSETVGLAMQEKGCHSLAEFILSVDKWFDCMNAGFQNCNFKATRKPYREIDDERLVWLQNDFLNYLRQWRLNAENRCQESGFDVNCMILSQSTEEGLMVSTLSIVALVKEVLLNGAKYVLARRINQDPLEAFFGYQRRRGGRGEVPSVRTFSSNARNFDVLRCNVVAGSNVELV